MSACPTHTATHARPQIHTHPHAPADTNAAHWQHIIITCARARCPAPRGWAPVRALQCVANADKLRMARAYTHASVRACGVRSPTDTVMFRELRAVRLYISKRTSVCLLLGRACTHMNMHATNSCARCTWRVVGEECGLHRCVLRYAVKVFRNVCVVPHDSRMLLVCAENVLSIGKHD